MKKLIAIIVAAVAAAAMWADQQGFVHQQSTDDGYVYPDDPAVAAKLEQWRDLKFGVLFHMGLYSVPGIVESWSICSEDVDWISRRSDLSYADYKRWYESLKDSLNPTDFDPAEWARIIDDAGMRYMIFTTKHHDGFCMFNSRLTDYSIAHGPFAGDPRRDFARHVFDAFRDRGLMTGAYFSKPDWHSQWFWNPAYATPNRHINYKKERHPDWWRNYQDYTAGQLGEILNNYGPLDILWLDGGWISGDDIHLDSILADARSSRQSGLLAVDRTIRGRNENYQTPERGIPDRQLSQPWESCIPLSNDWGWVPDAPYKSPEKVIATLIETVAKGGNLLLGVGPTAQGTIEPEVERRLHAIGQWLRRNGEAIYNTTTTPLYQDSCIWFTASHDGKTRYALYAHEENSPMPKRLTWKGNLPEGKMTLLDGEKPLSYSIKGDEVTVRLPGNVKAGSLAIRFTPRDTMPAYKNPRLTTDARVADLLRRMTLEEKIGQLLCPMGWEMYVREGDRVRTSEAFLEANASAMAPGSYWAVMRADPWTQKTIDNGLTPSLAASAANLLQREAVEKTRLGIPLLLAEECAHGHMAIGSTVFPTGLLMAATFNDSLMRRAGEAVGRETVAKGAHMAYGPVIDLARDPRWSRMEETFGEDQVLSGRLGSAYMEGLQSQGAAATLKHFTAYGTPEAGLNGNAAQTGRVKLCSDHLEPFREAVERGALSIMTSYNTIDGTPTTADSWLLTALLRDEWGFRGVVTSDLFSIDGIRGSGTAADMAEAAAQALKAGVDIDLGANAYRKGLPIALERGLVAISDIDRAVANVLRLKFDLGLFDNPYRDAESAAATCGSPQSRQLAREVAQEGIVLLKNSGILPLSKSTRRIAVIGPNADNAYNQLGDYTAPQADGEVATLLTGIREAVPDAEIVYARGCAIRDTLSADIDSAVEAARNADVAIVAVGGSSARDFKTSYEKTGAASATDALSDMDCGEGFDRSTLGLLGKQEELLQRVIATGTPTVVVYIAGRPLDMQTAAEGSGALLAAFYPGAEGGRALADIIFGDCNPSGRLPVTIPRSVGQLPIYYQQGERRDYIDGPGSPLYPFGYGLSYTTFDYSDLQILPPENVGELQRVECRVTNTGTREGAETVQLYISDPTASVSQPPVALRDFRKVTLKPGESRVVSFPITADHLAIYNRNLERVVEPGKFVVNISKDAFTPVLTATFQFIDR